MLYIISDILFCYVPTILFPLNALSWIRFFGGWKNRGTVLSPWIQDLSRWPNTWPWRRSFLVSGWSDSAPPPLLGSGSSQSATQIYRYQNMLCTNISILCKYIGIKICYVKIYQYCVYISVLNSESMPADNWIQVWAWLLYFISVHSCPQVSLQWL